MRELVCGGAVTVREVRACAARYAAKCLGGAEPKPLSPRSAGRFTSVLRHVLLEDDACRASLERRCPPFGACRRREALAALDALGAAPTRLGVAHLETASLDALQFAAFHAEPLRKAIERFRGVWAADALVRNVLALSTALRGRVSVGRLALEDAARMAPADRRRLEAAMQRKRKAMQLDDYRKQRFRAF